GARTPGHPAQPSLGDRMSRPLIGVTAYLEAARWDEYVREAVLSPPAYAKAVERAGGAPVVLPPISPHAIGDYVRALRGVVLTGGVEVGASTYGGEQDPRAPDPQPPRDRLELALARAPVQAAIPSPRHA